MNVWDYVILGLVAAAAAGALMLIRHNRKKGNGCCSDCRFCRGCETKQTNKKS